MIDMFQNIGKIRDRISWVLHLYPPGGLTLLAIIGLVSSRRSTGRAKTIELPNIA